MVVFRNLMELRGQTILIFDGLACNIVNAIAIDAQGNKWFGTGANNVFCGGVSEFDGTHWTTYSQTDGLADDVVFAIAIDAQDNKWFGCGNRSGVSKFDGKTWTNYTTSNSGLIDNIVNAIAIDEQGNEWFGTASGVSKYDGKTWTLYDTSNSGLTNDYVLCIAIDAQGNKWIGTDGNGVLEFEAASLSVSPNNLNILSSVNKTATFDINSNTSWNVSSNQTWLTVNKTSGSDSAKITVTALDNTNTSLRTAILTITGSGVKTDTVTITQAAATTGVTVNLNSDIQLYPIPVIDNMYILLSKSLSQSNIAIYSISGVQLFSTKFTGNNTEIDMSKYVSGLYFVKIVTADNYIITKKIIKK